MAKQSSRYVDIPLTRIEPSTGWFAFQLGELWRHRELLYFLTWRDLKVRYRQTVLGALWAVIQPLVMMVVFTVVFGNFAKVPSDGLPYPIFAYVALVPWNFFAGALSRCISSVVGNNNIIAKVYFPRFIVPLSAICSGFLDFVISLVILLAMMVWFGFVPNWGILLLPLFMVLALLTALGIGLSLAALNVRYRDIGHGVPFMIQLWMYASPVAYPVSLVPESWRWLYNLNPMAGVIEGFRWALLGKHSPDFGALATSTAVVLALLVAGMVYFKQTERTMVDVI
jgi:homopolymeric O-antigen transport system permease protein